ncbi:MAG: sulfurtransferase-like selenium metabolism protein YedF [Planctomycetota bacterium]|jgi:selenium metabolism protein YedF
MAEKQVDARGLQCPQPVLLTKEAIEDGDCEAICVIVDNDTACLNVERMGHSQGWEAKIERKGSEFHLHMRPTEEAPAAAKSEPDVSGSAEPKVAVFVKSDVFGGGDAELGRTLMGLFIQTLQEIEPMPKQVIFANAGVKIVTEGSDLVEDLKGLEKMGIEIISCGTCLDFYKLKDKLRVGRASNMYEIVTALANADRVVEP